MALSKFKTPRITFGQSETETSQRKVSTTFQVQELHSCRFDTLSKPDIKDIHWMIRKKKYVYASVVNMRLQWYKVFTDPEPVRNLQSSISSIYTTWST